MAELCKQVYSIERIDLLANRANKILKTLGYKNVKVLVADGSKGYAKNAPYDGIMVTAAADSWPLELIAQLKINKKIVLPLSDKRGNQNIYVATKKENGQFITSKSVAVRFVPLIKENEI